MTTTTKPRASTAERGHHALTSTWKLLGFALRRDRWRLLIWVGTTTVFLFAVVSSFPDLYPTAVERQARAALMSNPTGVLFTGPGHGLEDYTYGAMLGHEMLGFLCVVVALMSIFGVVRHTRAEEEAGRTELVRSGVVGRHADTIAAVIALVVANLVLAILLGLGLPALGADLGLGDSLLFGAAVGSVGVTFAALGALSAQLTQTARAANGVGGTVLAALFTLRAVGDLGDGTLSWGSPIGWAQATRVYVDARWWPLGLCIAFAVALVVTAVLVSDRRDVGAGILPPRAGHGHASSLLGHPLGFALRLQRGALVAWGAGLFAFGLMYGSFLEQVEEYAAANEFIQEWLTAAGAGTFTEAFAAQIALVNAMLCSGFAIQSALRPRAEEVGGRAEPVLTTGLSRSRWVSSHLAVTLAGSAGVLLLCGFGLGLTAALASGDASWIGRMVSALAVYVPAVWVLAGVGVALFGLAPRLVGLAWVTLGYAVAVGSFGPLLGLPDWLIRLTPFGHVPAVPAVGVDVAPLAILTGIAAAFVAAGLYGVRRRDLAAL